MPDPATIGERQLASRMNRDDPPPALREGAFAGHRLGSTDAAPQLILVVEDEPMVAEITCRIVREAGYFCKWVGSGAEALEVAKTLPADMWIIDIVLPDGPGIEVAREIHRRRPGSRVLFTSAYPEYRLAPPEAELGSFLPKPYSAAELIDAVRQHLPLAPLPRG